MSEAAASVRAQPSSALRWAKRGMAAGASLFVFALGFGAIFQAIASRSFSKTSPPGVRIDVGGHRLHLYCQGQGRPTVVVTSGVGVWSLQWRKIQESVARETRVCTYDRAGYGWSDLGSTRPTAEQSAVELHALLEGAGEVSPYLLVGESYGGYVTRLFVEKYRQTVAAVVLVESAHERQWDEIPEAKALALQAQQQLKIAQALSRVGFFHFWPMDRGEDLSPGISSALVASQARTQTFVAFAIELAGAFTSAHQAAATHSFGNLPLVVVSAAHSFDKFFPANEKWKTGLMNEKWMRLQDELARLSSNSLHLISPDATHGIAREQPEFIVAAIRRALKAAAAEPSQPN